MGPEPGDWSGDEFERSVDSYLVLAGKYVITLSVSGRVKLPGMFDFFGQVDVYLAGQAIRLNGLLTVS